MKRLSVVQQFALRSLAFVVVMALVLGFSITVAVRDLFATVAARTALATADTIVTHAVGKTDLSAFPIPAQLRQDLDAISGGDLRDAGITAVKLWNTDGVLLYSSEGQDEGRSFSDHPSLQAALNGETKVEVEPKERLENSAQLAEVGSLIEVYAPLMRDGEIVGVFEIYQDHTLVEQAISRFLVLMWTIIVLGSVPAYFLQLTLVKRTADELTNVKGALAEVHRRLRDSMEDIELHSVGTLQALVSAVDAKDSYTARHSIAVTDYAVAIARRLGLTDEQVRDIERAGLLHDVGKIGTPESILLKPGKLTDAEFDVMAEHSAMGGHIVETVPFLAELAPIVRGHHERWDGSGYPDGLAGERIPLLARVLTVADAFDAMTSERPYRTPIPVEAARAELLRCVGSQFDPAVVQALLGALDAGEVTVVVHDTPPRSRRERVGVGLN